MGSHRGFDSEQQVDEETHLALAQVTILLVQELLINQTVNIERITVRYMIQNDEPCDRIWLLGIDDIAYNFTPSSSPSIVEFPLSQLLARSSGSTPTFHQGLKNGNVFYE